MRLLLIAPVAIRSPRTPDGASEPGPPAAARARVAELGRLLPRSRAAYASPAPAARWTAAALGLSAEVVAALDEPRLEEPPDDLASRARSWLAGQEHADGTRAAVTHPQVVRAAVAAALGIAPAQAAAMDVAPLSVTELALRTGRWRLVRLNWEPALIHVPQRRSRRARRPASADTP